MEKTLSVQDILAKVAELQRRLNQEPEPPITWENMKPGVWYKKDNSIKMLSTNGSKWEIMRNKYDYPDFIWNKMPDGEIVSHNTIKSPSSYTSYNPDFLDFGSPHPAVVPVKAPTPIWNIEALEDCGFQLQSNHKLWCHFVGYGFDLYINLDHVRPYFNFHSIGNNFLGNFKAILESKEELKHLMNMVSVRTKRK